ncbi:unnamed protein product [Paramecium primaurelia]|uniref:Uncharacterized protein n=1 Tax=Paramecium primaurelia TaxID=5886 RepID=A0A8S1Q504_PARPR|nr:unnamed protein product [Paramecium primaurelia]
MAKQFMKVNIKMVKKLGNGILKLRMIQKLKKYKNKFIILSGYGAYDEKEHKNAIWLELSENYRNMQIEVTYYGEYKKDKKIGKWEIHYKYSSNYPFKQMQLLYIYINVIEVVDHIMMKVLNMVIGQN